MGPETVRALARAEARKVDTVHGFAVWCGITDRLRVDPAGPWRCGRAELDPEVGDVIVAPVEEAAGVWRHHGWPGAGLVRLTEARDACVEIPRRDISESRTL